MLRWKICKIWLISYKKKLKSRMKMRKYNKGRYQSFIKNKISYWKNWRNFRVKANSHLRWRNHKTKRTSTCLPLYKMSQIPVGYLTLKTWEGQQMISSESNNTMLLSQISHLSARVDIIWQTSWLIWIIHITHSHPKTTIMTVWILKLR
jgi:hypothetical protein